jgi:hypothetical protein
MWLFGWKRNNWKKSNGEPVANLDLVQKLYACNQLQHQHPKQASPNPCQSVAPRNQLQHHILFKYNFQKKN